MRTAYPILAILATLATACASTPGAEPHDMSVSNHEAMAASEDKNAAAHDAQYDPNQTHAATHCYKGSMCWDSLENPTAKHQEMAEQHRKAAADHRAASEALRKAEASACIGLPDHDRDMSPFDHREDIVSVDEFRLSTSPKVPAALRGASILFRAVPGMSVPELQRIIDCHIARNAALGHDVPEMPDCPLVPKGVTAKVTATDKGFAVVVEAEDFDVAREVLRRAKKLVSHP